MARRVVLHVGAMKSGTSYLQGLMMANREVLAEHDVMLPGRRWQDQVTGVAEILGRSRVAVTPRPGAWQQLVSEMDAWPGTGVVSMEFLGPVGLRKIERVVATLPAGTVEAVVTARDLNRNIPAMWQESLKNGGSFSFDEYVAAVHAHEGPGHDFWREQTVGAMCRRWSDVLGVDRVTLVTVAHPGGPPDDLWRRFATTIGAREARVQQPTTANESLGAASAEVLRRLNLTLGDLPFADYAPLVKHRLAKNVLGARREEEPGLGLEVPAWLPALSDRMINRLRDLGVRVVGDLEDLRPVDVPGVHPDDVDPDLRLDAALAGLEALLRNLLSSERA